MSEKVQLIKDFNDVLLSLTQNIAAVCPKSIIGTNITDIEKELTRTSNFVKFIDFFCIKVFTHSFHTPYITEEAGPQCSVSIHNHFDRIQMRLYQF